MNIWLLLTAGPQTLLLMKTRGAMLGCFLGETALMVSVLPQQTPVLMHFLRTLRSVCYVRYQVLHTADFNADGGRLIT